MKIRLLTLLLIVPMIFGCRKFDDSHLWDSINSLNNRVERLETICDKMNANISSLQAIVQALQTNDAVKSVTSLPNGEGYTINFVSGKSINIYNGRNGTNGADGTDGKDGQDGKNGVTPVISVKKDIDGIYYWTVNGEWLIVDGNKVKAVGTDGADGENGTDGKDGVDGEDGITPKFKIKDGYWYISYDNELSWEQLGKATGDNGLNGSDGESFFKGVSIENGYVCFILNDYSQTEIKIPFYSNSELTIHIEEAGTLASIISETQERTTINLTVSGHVNNDDIQFIRYHMFAVENLRIVSSDSLTISADGFKGMTRLKTVELPESTKTIAENAFEDCNLLTNLSAKYAQIDGNSIHNCPYLKEMSIGYIKGTFENMKARVTLNGNFKGIIKTGNISVDTLIIGENVKIISTGGLKNSRHIIFDANSKVEEISDGIFADSKSLETIVLPAKLKSIGGRSFRGCGNLSSVVFPENCEIETIRGDFSIGNTSASAFGLFENCPLLTYLQLPASLTSIRGATFLGSSITTLEIMGETRNLKIEGEYHRYYMDYYSITKGALPQTMKKFICHRVIPPTCNNYTFIDFSKINCTLYVPEQSLAQYRQSSDWKEFKEILPIEEYVEE